MPMVLIDLLDANPVLEGQLSRRLLVVRPGLYVGGLSVRQIEVIWEEVVRTKPRAALLVYAARNEVGISIRSIGDHRYTVVESDGLQLVATRQRKSSW